uniref:Uncharacterized protein n=1 Tax=Anopheles merus TaxID=30066 RepID=A0A182V4K3_ANOME
MAALWVQQARDDVDSTSILPPGPPAPPPTLGGWPEPPPPPPLEDEVEEDVEVAEPVELIEALSAAPPTPPPLPFVCTCGWCWSVLATPLPFAVHWVCGCWGPQIRTVPSSDADASSAG